MHTSNEKNIISNFYNKYSEAIVDCFVLLGNNYIMFSFRKCSFFLEKSSIGCSRGQAAMELLTEMNSDVKGDYIEEVQ